NNVFLKDEKDSSNNNNNQSSEADIEEIELSSNNDDDDDDDDRIETVHTPHNDEPINSTNIVIEQDESSFMSAE
ncbi:unnamed protein product, partial [Rotaria magnacalcarata]